MKKIPTIFERDWNGDKSRVLNVQTPECAWVFAGEGVATVKYDGTCCLVKDGRLYKRREIKDATIATPEGFLPVDADETTGNVVGWVPVSDTDPADRWHREAFGGWEPDGTYELLGPKIQGNSENFPEPMLMRHGSTYWDSPIPRTFDGLREFLAPLDMEGIVFHHPDGRMAKIKKRDFGMSRRSTP